LKLRGTDRTLHDVSHTFLLLLDLYRTFGDTKYLQLGRRLRY
jgi:hypothetical protein